MVQPIDISWHRTLYQTMKQCISSLHHVAEKHVSADQRCRVVFSSIFLDILCPYLINKQDHVIKANLLNVQRLRNQTSLIYFTPCSRTIKELRKWHSIVPWRLSVLLCGDSTMCVRTRLCECKQDNVRSLKQPSDHQETNGTSLACTVSLGTRVSSFLVKELSGCCTFTPCSREEVPS